MDFEVSCCLQPWPAYFVSGRVGGPSGFIPSDPEEGAPAFIDLDFLPDGMLSGVFDVTLDHDELYVSGGGMNWSGYIGEDPFLFSVTGYWIDAALLVPEPASIALLFFSLIGTIWFHHHRRHHRP
jgi:hypothetical protein